MSSTYPLTVIEHSWNRNLFFMWKNCSRKFVCLFLSIISFKSQRYAKSCVNNLRFFLFWRGFHSKQRLTSIRVWSIAQEYLFSLSFISFSSLRWQSNKPADDVSCVDISNWPADDKRRQRFLNELFIIYLFTLFSVSNSFPLFVNIQIYFEKEKNGRKQNVKLNR
jgi:hypothetical protein